MALFAPDIFLFSNNGSFSRVFVKNILNRFRADFSTQIGSWEHGHGGLRRQPPVLLMLLRCLAHATACILHVTALYFACNRAVFRLLLPIFCLQLPVLRLLPPWRLAFLESRVASAASYPVWSAVEISRPKVLVFLRLWWDVSTLEGGGRPRHQGCLWATPPGSISTCSFIPWSLRFAEMTRGY